MSFDVHSFPTPPPPPPRQSRRAVLALVVVLVTAATVAAALVAGRESESRSSSPTTTTEGSRGSGDPTTTTDAVNPALQAVFDEMRAQVSEIRGLQWKGDIPIRLVTREELAARVRAFAAEDLERYREELDDGETLLKLLGLVPAEVNYRTSLEDLYAGRVLGYYDEETKELVVGRGSGRLDVFTRSTLVHELTHALTDQHFNFSTLSRSLDDAGRTEEAAALVALVEGDAELVRTLWEERYLDPREQAMLASGPSDLDLSVYVRTPPYLLDALSFPYRSGAAFVEALQRRQGFGPVDAAYRQPPVSTAHILHPERYQARDLPVERPPAPVPSGCTKLDDGALGEFDMRALLSLELSPTRASRAAAGWDGDRYTLARCGTRDGVIDQWVAVDEADAQDLVAALNAWAPAWAGSPPPDASGRFAGPIGAGLITRVGPEVRLVLADDATTRDLLATALGAPTGP